VDAASAGLGVVTLLVAMFVSHLQLGRGVTPERLESMFQVLTSALLPGRARAGVNPPPPAREIERLPQEPPPSTKGERTRDRLLDAAIHRFSNGGYAGTSVAQIARDVGITPAAAFAHFASKDLLLDAAFDRDVLALMLRVSHDLAEIDVVDRWPAIVKMLWEVVAEYSLVDHVVSGTEPELPAPAHRDAGHQARDRGVRGAGPRRQDRGIARDDIDAAVISEGLVDLGICMLVARGAARDRDRGHPARRGARGPGSGAGVRRPGRRADVNLTPRQIATYASAMGDQAYQLYIGGEWVDGGGGAYEVVNPATEAVVGLAPQATVEQSNDATAAAAEAFDSWSRTSPEERARLLDRVADLVDERTSELVPLVQAETGATMRTTKTMQVPQVAARFRRYARGALEPTIVPLPRRSCRPPPSPPAASCPPSSTAPPSAW